MIGTQPAYAIFYPKQPKNPRFHVWNSFFLSWPLTHQAIQKHALGSIYVVFPIALRAAGFQWIGRQFVGKSKFPKLIFLYGVTQHHHPSNVKHLLGSMRVFFILLGYPVRGRGLSNRVVTIPLMQFFTQGAQKVSRSLCNLFF